MELRLVHGVESVFVHSMISGYSFSPILKQNCKTPHLGRDVTFLYKAISFPLGGLIRNRQGRRRASRRHQ